MAAYRPVRQISLARANAQRHRYQYFFNPDQLPRIQDVWELWRSRGWVAKEAAPITQGYARRGINHYLYYNAERVADLDTGELIKDVNQ